MTAASTTRVTGRLAPGTADACTTPPVGVVTLLVSGEDAMAMAAHFPRLEEPLGLLLSRARLAIVASDGSWKIAQLDVLGKERTR